MRWSEIEYDFYKTFDENEKVKKGFLLSRLGVDLEDIPDIFFGVIKYCDENQLEVSAGREGRVYLKDVVGSFHSDYSNVEWIQAFQRLKRASHYIEYNFVTLGKYLRELKLPIIKQKCPETPIGFIEKNDGYYIYGNGNHRVIMYKMMYMAEISKANTLSDIKKTNNKYWLNAKVYKSE
jgi:hypothetical protein